MMSIVRRVLRRLQITGAVLVHGPSGLPQPRSTQTAASGPKVSGRDHRRRVVQQSCAEPTTLPHRHEAFRSLAAPRTARDRFDRAMSTDTEHWRALGVVDPERQGTGVPAAEIDVWGADDPALDHAAGYYRARLLEPGTPPSQVIAAALSGTPMFAQPGTIAALPERERDLVTAVAGIDELRDELLPLLVQDELFDRASQRLRRLATRRYATDPDADRLVSAVIPTNRPHQIPHVLATIGRQRHEVELVLVLHGLELTTEEVHAQAQQAGVERLVVVHADADLTLGACMNLGVDAASGTYIAKMDDDNYYGPEFLGDLVDAVAYSGAAIVGKWGHLVWLRSSGAVVMRYADSEHRMERRIQGGSMLFTAEAVRDVRFSDIPRAVDSDILDRSLAAGYEVYSADRFNFVSIRETDPQRHTWKVSDATFFTRKGTLVFYGDPSEHAQV